MEKTRMRCYEIPSVYVALAIKRANERKAAPGVRLPRAPVQTGTAGPMPVAATSKRFLSMIKLIERPRKVA